MPQVAGAGVNSASATCVDTKPQGGLTFVSRSATDSGYQPFISGNATTVSFYVKQTASGSPSIGAASGATIPPSIQLGLGDDDTVQTLALDSPSCRSVFGPRATDS